MQKTETNKHFLSIVIFYSKFNLLYYFELSLAHVSLMQWHTRASRKNHYRGIKLTLRNEEDTKGSFLLQEELADFTRGVSV